MNKITPQISQILFIGYKYLVSSIPILKQGKRIQSLEEKLQIFFRVLKIFLLKRMQEHYDQKVGVYCPVLIRI